MASKGTSGGGRKQGGRQFNSSLLDIVERCTTAVSTPVRQLLMSIGAHRMLRSSRSINVTSGRADSIANKTL